MKEIRNKVIRSSTADMEEAVSYVEQSLQPSDTAPNEDSRGFSFLSVSATMSKNGKTRELNVKQEVGQMTFDTNFKYWREETRLRSVNNFDNANFDSIVEMGVEAVPYIREVLEKGPSPIVHALDLIFPGVVKYNGYTTIEEACNIWLPLIRMI